MGFLDYLHFLIGITLFDQLLAGVTTYLKRLRMYNHCGIILHNRVHVCHKRTRGCAYCRYLCTLLLKITSPFNFFFL